MRFFIQEEGEDGIIYEFTATTSAVYNTSGKATTYAVEEGSNLSDHYTQDQDTVTLQGHVSPEYVLGFTDKISLKADLATMEKGLVDLKKSGKPFSVTYSDNLDVMSNCVFDNLSITRNVSTGIHTMDVSLTARQLELGGRAATTTIKEPAERFKDPSEEKKSGSGSTVTDVEGGDTSLAARAVKLNPSLSNILSR